MDICLLISSFFLKRVIFIDFKDFFIVLYSLCEFGMIVGLIVIEIIILFV